MIYLIVCNNITYEAFTDKQKADDRVKFLNKTLQFYHKLICLRWTVKKMLLQ
jgi:hypothetical protein